MKGKMKDRLNSFVERNRQRIIAGSLLVTMGVSSLLGFAGGTAMEQKAHDKTKEKLDSAIGRINDLTEEGNEKSAQIDALINETEALIKKYEDAMKAMSGSSKEFLALVNSKISILANLVETKEYSQAHRVNVNNAVIELNGLINNATSMSEAEKQSLLELVDTLESKYVIANIENACNNLFESDAVKASQQTTETRDGVTSSYSQTVLSGENVTVGASQSSFNTIWKVYPDDTMERCEVDISEIGKITNPTAYYEGEMYGIGTKNVARENLVNEMKSIEWNNWDYDVSQDCYAGSFKYDDMSGVYTFDIDGNDLASYSIKAQGNAYESNYSIEGKMELEGVPQVIFEQQLAAVTKILEEAKALENLQEKGE